MGPHLVDADWYAFCQALYKGIEGEDWEEMYDSYKVLSSAVGVKKPQEVQQAKNHLENEGSKEAGEYRSLGNPRRGLLSASCFWRIVPQDGGKYLLRGKHVVEMPHFFNAANVLSLFTVHRT